MPSSTYLVPHRGLGAVQALPIYGAQTKENQEFTVTLAPRPVSYTHLTLPTICSV